MNKNVLALSVSILSMGLVACGGGGGGEPAFSSGNNSGSSSVGLVIAQPKDTTTSAPVSAEDLSGHYVDNTGRFIGLVGRDGVTFSINAAESGIASFSFLAPRKATDTATTSSFKDSAGTEYVISESLSGGSVRLFDGGAASKVSGSFDGKLLRASFVAGSRKRDYVFSPDALNNEAAESMILGQWSSNGSLPFKVAITKNGSKGFVVSGSYTDKSNTTCNVFGLYEVSDTNADAVPFRNVLSFNSSTAGGGLSVTCGGDQSFKTAVIGLNGSTLLFAIKDVPVVGSGVLLAGVRPAAPTANDQSSGFFVAGSGSRGHLAMLSGSSSSVAPTLIDLERDADGISKENDRLVFSSFNMNAGRFTGINNSFGFSYQGAGSSISDRIFIPKGSAGFSGSYGGKPRIVDINKTDTVNGESLSVSLSLKPAFDAGGIDAGSMSGSFCAGDGKAAACDIGTSVSVSSTTIQGTMRYAPCSDLGVCNSKKIDQCVIDGSLGDVGGVGVFDAAFSVTCPGASQIVRNYLGTAAVLRVATGTEAAVNASEKLVIYAREAGNRDARVFIFKRAPIGAATSLSGAFISTTTNNPLDAFVTDQKDAVLATNLAGRLGEDSMLFGRLSEDANGGISLGSGDVYSASGAGVFGGMIQKFTRLTEAASGEGSTTADGSSIALSVSEPNGTGLNADFDLFKRLATGPGETFSEVLNKDFCVTTVDETGAPVMGPDGKPVSCDILQLTIDTSGAIQGKIDFPHAGRLYQDCSIIGALAGGSVESKNIAPVQNLTLRCDEGINFAFNGVATSIRNPAPSQISDSVLHLLLRDGSGSAVRLRFTPSTE